MRTAMIAMTTSSSIRVNPDGLRFFGWILKYVMFPLLFYFPEKCSSVLPRVRNGCVGLTSHGDGPNGRVARLLSCRATRTGQRQRAFAPLDGDRPHPHWLALADKGELQPASIEQADRHHAPRNVFHVAGASSLFFDNPVDGGIQVGRIAHRHGSHQVRTRAGVIGHEV